ncbi:MAG TPA: TetR/AcrR family transcriptional regulator [Moraxellaceae bacterium]|nr:TetR/AcrR family transcriptional regulator [Moraxellaceae bacterium]
MSANPPSPPPRRGYGGRTAEALAAERRQRLLETALELFGTQGYAATSTEKLCAAARVTTRHFYEQFRDREALLLEVFRHVMQDTRGRVTEALLVASGPPQDRLLAALEAFLDAQLDDPRRARLTTTEVLGVSPLVEARRNEVINDFARLIETYADLLAQMGLLPRRNFRVLAFCIVGAMHELQIAWLNPANDLTREAVKGEMRFLVQAFLAGATVA